MANRELYWGLFFLFSSVFIFSIALWKFLVVLKYSEIILFKIYEYIFFGLSIIVTGIAIGSMYKSFFYFKTDLTDQKTIKVYYKVIVAIILIYQFYNIYLAIDMITRW